MAVIKIVPMPGPTTNNGASGDIADFEFDLNVIDENISRSTVTIHNHDMTIQTLRDANQDSDINIESADDVFIRAFGDELSLFAETDVTIQNGIGGGVWSFANNKLTLPQSTNLFDAAETIQEPETVSGTYSRDYSGGIPAPTNGNGVMLEVDSVTSWFVNKIGTFGINTGTILFGDDTTETITTAYNWQQGEIPTVVIAWENQRSIVYPVVIEATVNKDVYQKSLNIELRNLADDGTVSWRLDNDGTLTSPPGHLTISNPAAPGDIVLSAYNGTLFQYSQDGGGVYLGDRNPESHVATLGDLGQDTPYIVEGGSLGVQPTFSGVPLFSGSYVKMSNNLVHFEIQVEMDNITSFGTGQYFVLLPFASKYGYTFRDGCLHDFSTGTSYHITGHVEAGGNTLTLFTSDTQGNNLSDFTFTSTEPITLAPQDNFHIGGTYIIEGTV